MNDTNPFTEVFKPTVSLNDTVADFFFKDMDKLAGAIRLDPLMVRNDVGVYVDYQNITPDQVGQRMLKHGWVIGDMGQSHLLMVNRDGVQVQLTKVDTGSNLLAVRITLLEQKAS